jgi:hypothetical protein
MRLLMPVFGAVDNKNHAPMVQMNLKSAIYGVLEFEVWRVNFENIYCATADF